MGILVLDGGMGRELQRSGAPFRQPEWSALALWEAPEMVTRAHAAFVSAGADVISTNSYALVPFHIGQDRFDREARQLADLAGELARAAAGTKARVAGSLSPVCGSYRPDLFDETVARPVLTELIAGLSPHVDFWLAETQSSIAEAVLLADLLKDDGRPKWISFTLDDNDVEAVASGKAAPALRSGELVADAAVKVKALGFAALCFNCSQPEIMEAAIRAARAAAGEDLPIGVYANAFPPQPKEATANDGLDPIREDLTPENYLGFARKWRAAGASYIGGCCGIGPEHIHALAEGFKAEAA